MSALHHMFGTVAALSLLAVPASLTAQRANTIWKRMVAEYEQPPIDPAIDEALRDYMDRRKAEGGSPLN